jgi:hypothetical protein
VRDSGRGSGRSGSSECKAGGSHAPTVKRWTSASSLSRPHLPPVDRVGLDDREVGQALQVRQQPPRSAAAP